MNFKDKQYYIQKAKEYVGLILTAALFDLFVILIIIL